MSLRNRDTDAVELMDDPACDDGTLERTYAAFRRVNAAVAGWRRTYRDRIRPRLSATTPTELLDVGCGGGDLAFALASWARRDGLRLEVTGVDPDPRGIRVARAAAAAPQNATTAGHVRFVEASAGDLPAGSFGLVVSNHVLHHIADLPAFLDETLGVCAPDGLVLHSDLRRSRVAYAAFAVGMLPFYRDTLIRADGLTSIRRAYTEAELRAAVGAGWVVTPARPYRLLLTHG